MTKRECDCSPVDTKLIEKIRVEMPTEDILQGLSNIFKITSDKTRIRLLWALDKHEMCVCDLSNLLNMTKSAVSHQLKALKIANLVKSEKRGRHVFYSLSDNHVKTIFEKAIEHVTE